MNLIEGIVVISLFLILLVIIAQILLDKRNKFLNIKTPESNDNATYEKIKQLKNELRQDTKDRTAKNPVLDILIKHKKADSLVSKYKYKPEFSVDKPLKLEELQEELDVTKKDITEEEIDDVEEDTKEHQKTTKPFANIQKIEKKAEHRKIEDLIGKNIESNDTIINQNNYFALSSGRFIKNIPELIEAIEQMPHIEFERYVSANNNDFANWIEHVFNNPDLAHELRQNTSKRHQIFVLKNHIK